MVLLSSEEKKVLPATRRARRRRESDKDASVWSWRTQVALAERRPRFLVVCYEGSSLA